MGTRSTPSVKTLKKPCKRAVLRGFFLSNGKSYINSQIEHFINFLRCSTVFHCFSIFIFPETLGVRFLEEKNLSKKELKKRNIF